MEYTPVNGDVEAEVQVVVPTLQFTFLGANKSSPLICQINVVAWRRSGGFGRSVWKRFGHGGSSSLDYFS